MDSPLLQKTTEQLKLLDKTFHFLLMITCFLSAFLFYHLEAHHPSIEVGANEFIDGIAYFLGKGGDAR